MAEFLFIGATSEAVTAYCNRRRLKPQDCEAIEHPDQLYKYVRPVVFLLPGYERKENWEALKTTLYNRNALTERIGNDY